MECDIIFLRVVFNISGCCAAGPIHTSLWGMHVVCHAETCDYWFKDFLSSLWKLLKTKKI